ncbi:MAG: hypothetical protein ABI868_05120 [Acidobacteriota bacterium]
MRLHPFNHEFGAAEPTPTLYTLLNAVIPDTTRPAAEASSPVHSYSVRICHWINLVAWGTGGTNSDFGLHWFAGV